MREEAKKQQKKAEKKEPAEKKLHEGKKKEEKRTEINFVLLTIFVLCMLAIILLGIKVLAKPKVISIDDLHEQNLKGKLAPEKGYVYNGFSFVYANGMWFTRIRNLKENQVFNIQLHYSPRQLENISIDGEIMQFSYFNGTYVTFDPVGADLSHVGLAASELSINLATFFNMLVVAACAKNETQICHVREIVNCETNDKNPIIYIEEAARPKIVQQKNCIRIQGNGFDLVRAADKLIYAWLGIIPAK